MSEIIKPPPITPLDMADLQHRVLFGHRFDPGSFQMRMDRTAASSEVFYWYSGRDLEIAHGLHRVAAALHLAPKSVQREIAGIVAGLRRP